MYFVYSSMQFICHILLLVVCVGTFVDCKGGRGGGGRGHGSIRGRARYGGARYSGAGYSGARYSGSHQKESKSCNTDQCQSERAIFGIIFFVGAPSIIFVLIVLCILCCKSDDRTNEKIDQHTNTTKYKGNCESNLQVNKKPLAKPTSVCQKNDINPTTSTIPEVIDRTHNPSESIHYNPQLNTIITLEPNK
ncbi:unnamed protein product [Adineta steineri]|uniref:Uncharacterized protein n=2 Tax=Adineta steineri TaxID=433720 RepID=A0A814Q406_9BILA|nr:unnamed protein product [Adineta steineri]CAF1131846.1 unnamed protein product [Adineta steineri]